MAYYEYVLSGASALSSVLAAYTGYNGHWISLAVPIAALTVPAMIYTGIHYLVLAAAALAAASPLCLVDIRLAPIAVLNAALPATLLAIWSPTTDSVEALLPTLQGAWNILVYIPIVLPTIYLMMINNTYIRAQATFWIFFAIILAVSNAFEYTLPGNALLCAQGVFSGAIQWALERNNTEKNSKENENAEKSLLHVEEPSERTEEKTFAEVVEHKVDETIVQVETSQSGHDDVCTPDGHIQDVLIDVTACPCPIEDHLEIPTKKSEENDKRLAIIEEIMTTEQNYVLKLTALVEHFVNPLTTLAEQGLLKQSKEDINSLFKGIIAIYRFHIMFIEKLNQNDNYGKVFKECAQFLKMYTGMHCFFAFI
jgi:hypothetical protein